MLQGRRRVLGIGAVVLAGLLATPAAGEAATEFGSKLNEIPTDGTYCDPCTMWNAGLYPGGPGTVTAPADGVVVRFTIRKVAGPSTAGGIRLRVIRAAGSLWSAVGSSASVTPLNQTGLESFETRVPIRAGDFIGLDFPSYSGYDVLTRDVFLADGRVTAPLLPDDGTPTPQGGTNDWELALRGTLEPDADHDGFGDETQDLCPGRAGPNTGCPPAVRKKKCKKKHAKKKRALAAKKKHCKKRKKR
jgi:hypothetical protein